MSRHELVIESPDGRDRWTLTAQDDRRLILYSNGQPIFGWMAQVPAAPPTPPPPPPLVPITLGNWRGNFMYDAGFYFSPSLAAWSADRRQALYAWWRSQGYTHGWVNAQQDDWDPRYTAGGFDAFASPEKLDHLIKVLIEMRQAGFIPCLGLHDHAETRRLIDAWGADLGLTELIRRDQQLIDATHDHVALYMGMTWELNEIEAWASGDKRNPAIIRYFDEIDNRGRDIGIHYAPSDDSDVYGGFENLWNHLPTWAVRLQQFPKDCDDDELSDRTGQAVVVHQAGLGKLCIFEHSRMDVPGRPGGGQSLDEAHRRARVCLDVIGDRLPPERKGSMNG